MWYSEEVVAPTEDAKLPTESLISHNGRQKLENEVMKIATSRDVQSILRHCLLDPGKNTHSAKRGSIYLAANKGREVLRLVFEEGVRRIVQASCDRRLEVMHWMVDKAQQESSMAVVEFLLLEAEHQIGEAEENEAKELVRLFGSR